MVNNIKAVIFDWGGVVAPNKNGGWIKQLSILLNISLEDAFELWSKTSPGLRTGLINEKQFWKLVEQSIDKPLPKNKSKIWQDGLASEPYPVIIKYATKLKTQGIKTAILSNTIEPMERIINLDNLYKDFDYVVLSHRVGVTKPNPEIFNILLQKISIKPTECIFVDDVEKNIKTARAMGFQVIHAIDDPISTIAELDMRLLNKD
ncbi:MAG: HAD family phosphatase [Patescibacteria group bacterium]|jgi:epoxide hydrolase-like predicted phosphatase|nr:HAD family phosphatase [Patescibacteria group bacterium]